MGMYVFSHFVFNRDINNYKPEIKQYLQQMALECQYLLPCTKIKSKWIKDLNVKPKHLKLLGENNGSALQVKDVRRDFLNRVLLS